MGVVISKRQVVRLLTAKLETFRAEDEAVLKAGLCGAYVTVDDTGARHAGKNGYTTQIGSYNFTTFRTGPSKSRLAFLSRLCGGVSLYVINDAALAYMEERNLPQIVIGKFKEHKARIFSSAGDWESHLHALGLSAMKVAPDPVLIASEAALWGAIHHQGLLPDTVIVSDDAGQFRVGAHALCWIHAERLVHKLVPANDKQRNAIHRQAILGVPHGRKWDVLEIRLVLGLAATGDYGRLPCRHVRLDGEIARNQSRSGRGYANPKSFHRRDGADCARRSDIAWS